MFFNAPKFPNNKNTLLGSIFDSSNYSHVIIEKIDDVVEYYKDAVNEIILKEEFYKMSSFLSGKFFINYVETNNYTCAYELYFQESKGDSYKLETQSKPLDMSRLSDEAQKDLKTQKTVKYDIPEPSEEFRKKYKLVKI